MFNLAIDSKLRGCDVVALKVADVAPKGHALERASIRQQKTGQPVRFNSFNSHAKRSMTMCGLPIRSLTNSYDGHPGSGRGLSTRQYARLVSEWVASVGLDPRLFGTHSLRRTKATLIYRRTGNLRAVQLLLGHRKIESTSPVSWHRG